MVLPAVKDQILQDLDQLSPEQQKQAAELVHGLVSRLPKGASIEDLMQLAGSLDGVRAEHVGQAFHEGDRAAREVLEETAHLLTVWFGNIVDRLEADHRTVSDRLDEVAPYVMHRLACAGWKGTPRFTQSAYDAFHHYSDGVPRRLNMLAGRVMLQGAIERLIDIDAEVVEDVRHHRLASHAQHRLGRHVRVRPETGALAGKRDDDLHVTFMWPAPGGRPSAWHSSD